MADPVVSEDVQLAGHIIDSLLLPKVLDAILTRGGSYDIREMKVGQRGSDPSHARITVRAPTQEGLQEILGVIHAHGALPVDAADCDLQAADVDGAFPEGFYCSTNFRTQVRVGGEWIDVRDQEMDCGLLVDLAAKAARCVPMTDVRLGEHVVVGRRGVRVFPETAGRRSELFEFMSSPVSSEKPKGATVREIAAAMRRSKGAGEKILAVLGPAVVHTGGSDCVGRLIRNGYLNVLFAGNALATHDMEQALYGTSLGVSLDRGLRRTRGTNTTCGRSTRSAGSAASPLLWTPEGCPAASCTSA